MESRNTILIRKRDGSDITIFENDKQNKTFNFPVDEVNKQIIDFIFDYQRRFFTDIKLDKNFHKGPKEFNSMDITVKMFSVMNYGKCSIFLCTQSSKVGKRYLAYFSTEIMNHGDGFENGVSNSFIIETIKDFLTANGITEYTNVKDLFGL